MSTETKWTDEEVLLFLSVAFRHVEIKGDLAFDDVRLGIQFVNKQREQDAARTALASARGEG